MEEKIIKVKTNIELAKQGLTELLEDKTLDKATADNIHYSIFRLIQADRKL